MRDVDIGIMLLCFCVWLASFLLIVSLEFRAWPA